jgi:beta-glucanase (GH16 family)
MWPPEIDVMENTGQPTTAYFTSHYSMSYPGPGTVANYWNYGSFLQGSYLGPDLSAGFHAFGLDWEPTGLTWYVDGVARYSTSQHLPPGTLAPGQMYVIANLAVGGPGSMPGPPDASTVFPQSLDIQYIHVYQKVTNGTPPRQYYLPYVTK